MSPVEYVPIALNVEAIISKAEWQGLLLAIYAQRQELEWARALLTPIAGPWEPYGFCKARLILSAALRGAPPTQVALVFPLQSRVAPELNPPWGWRVLEYEGRWDLSRVATCAGESGAKAAADAALRAAGWFLRDEEG